jgi:hypothetical protein
MQHTIEVLVKELQMYESQNIVKLIDDNEVELDIDFVDYDDSVGIVYIKGYLQ